MALRDHSGIIPRSLADWEAAHQSEQAADAQRSQANVAAKQSEAQISVAELSSEAGHALVERKRRNLSSAIADPVLP